MAARIFGFLFGASVMIFDYLWMRKSVESKFIQGYSHRKLVFYLLASLFRWACLGALLIGGILIFQSLKDNIIAVFLGLTVGVIVVSFLSLKKKSSEVVR